MNYKCDMLSKETNCENTLSTNAPSLLVPVIPPGSRHGSNVPRGHEPPHRSQQTNKINYIDL